MFVVPTNNGLQKVPYIEVETQVDCSFVPSNEDGLVREWKISPEEKNDEDYFWYRTNARKGDDEKGQPGNHDFSVMDQLLLKQHMERVLKEKDQVNIVEIGVCRDFYDRTSTSIFLQGKRSQDVYIGIDAEDRSHLNNANNNVFILKSFSQDEKTVFDFLEKHNVDKIDILFIDGYHSVNQVYAEWKLYSKLVTKGGIVGFHDTNGHPGPYFLLKSIDPAKYDVYKYLTDVRDFGIGFAIKK